MTTQANRLCHLGALAVLGVALALASIVVATPRPAHANSPAYIFAYGGPGEIWVKGCGFTAATVRLVALNSDLTKTLRIINVPVDSYGCLREWSGIDGAELGSISPYVGHVWVAADQTPYIGTAWAQTDVKSAPVFIGIITSSCQSVTVSVYGFQSPYYNVRFTLLSSDRSRVLDSKTVSTDLQFGDAGATLNVTPYGSYFGPAWVVADEFDGGGGTVPAPATIWANPTIC